MKARTRFIYDKNKALVQFTSWDKKECYDLANSYLTAVETRCDFPNLGCEMEMHRNEIGVAVLMVAIRTEGVMHFAKLKRIFNDWKKEIREN